MTYNIVGLRKIYNRSMTVHKTWLDYSEAIHLFTQETGLLNEYQAKKCYGYSKMTP